MINIENNSKVFSCPICHSSMNLLDKSLICLNNHSYDLAKSGYINFLSRPVKSDYDKSLWAARRETNLCGVFDELIQSISLLINKHSQSSESSFILDAGCGEGSHLATLLNNNLPALSGVGIDLSKDGVLMASKKYKEQIWCVGDLTATPFRDDAFSVILNILSPANYTEFSRILSPSGIVIKVIPASNYLKELREVFYANTKSESYSNDEVITLFEDNFSLLENKPLTYSFDLENDLLENIIKMSPLSWSVDKNKTALALSSGIKSITMDFNILIGSKVK